ncbi:hypothetical protein [Noviherbaspirillum pedocola]|uniref:Uncharacterized protein n=1 Tax=Noviherbaspirillum pedocola TaxID=2801341 RepID=A0A934SZJ0_9BURK|nr:hypothetical protein [Noviherbaspirillum pedocola]MBK4734603.1 hypothetical protein [Noviherbaspirillum pedocola]
MSQTDTDTSLFRTCNAFATKAAHAVFPLNLFAPRIAASLIADFPVNGMLSSSCA